MGSVSVGTDQAVTDVAEGVVDRTWPLPGFQFCDSQTGAVGFGVQVPVTL